MPNKLIICLDGTWNTEKDDKRLSNVWLISQLLVNDDNDQLVKHFRGVGTKGIDFSNPLELGKHIFHKVVGGYSGYGISENIREAYRLIADKYIQGTDIFIFGFSRGAFTARSLSGFMDMVGVLSKAVCDEYTKAYGRNLIDDAYNYYRLPEDEYSNRLARKMCLRYFGATCRNSFVISAINNGGERLFSDILESIFIKRNDFNPPDRPDARGEIDWTSIRIEVLGVWDTVSALGAKTRFTQPYIEPWINFHNADISDNVIRAYQALALHEVRELFKPEIWISRGHKCIDLEQMWFSGAHANIGGGYTNQVLSNVSLQWMIEKASRPYNPLHGHPRVLKFHTEKIKNYKSCCACTSPIEHSRTIMYRHSAPFNRLIHLPQMDKDIETSMKIHDSARCRADNPIYSGKRKHRVDVAEFQRIDALCGTRFMYGK